ncbi:hypothetical protein GQ54DRAFT_305818 [Martensiomyces pterosporus]|nr:hypothetical protein GQ54DRAFT_305818 [Martensiomyces pterosporus]
MLAAAKHIARFAAVFLGSSTAVQASFCTSISPSVLDVLIPYVNFEYMPTKDARGGEVVGHEHVCAQPQCRDVSLLPLTRDTARAMFVADLTSIANVQLNDNQWAAVVLWAYNVGCDEVLKSVFVKELNAGDQDADAIARNELPKYKDLGSDYHEGCDEVLKSVFVKELNAGDQDADAIARNELPKYKDLGSDYHEGVEPHLFQPPFRGSAHSFCNQE